jgi:hypothetical protein
MPLSMADQRALAAIDRIERALARIEQGAERLKSGGADSERLRHAHDALKRKVAGAIGELDLIIDQAERG